jgi:hypothetical protein
MRGMSNGLWGPDWFLNQGGEDEIDEDYFHRKGREQA